MRYWIVEYFENENWDCQALLRILLFRHRSVLGFVMKLPMAIGYQKIIVCLGGKPIRWERSYIRHSLKIFMEAYPDAMVTEKIYDNKGSMSYYF